MSKLQEGSKAPDFTLRDQNEKDVKLSDFKGKWLLIYFYPKDDTPGCTKEACGIRDHFAQYKKAGLHVLGISVDGSASHRKFSDKYSLPFTLLADEEKEVVQSYGVWGKKKFMGKEYLGIFRTSFVLDPAGKIVKIYPEVKPEEHALQVLTDVRELMKLRE